MEDKPKAKDVETGGTTIAAVGRAARTNATARDNETSMQQHQQQQQQRQRKPIYTGYTFWSSDLHVAPIGDMRNLLVKPFNMTIIDKSMSGHCHFVGTCQTDLKVLPGINVFELNAPGTKEGGPQDCKNDVRERFYAEYKSDPEMLTVDAFFCHHLASICELYMAFDRPLIVVASTRYGLGRGPALHWSKWNDNLRAIASNARNVVAANNKYDAEYIKYFTGLRPCSHLEMRVHVGTSAHK
jgi:hypothetical protein